MSPFLVKCEMPILLSVHYINCLINLDPIAALIKYKDDDCIYY